MTDNSDSREKKNFAIMIVLMVVLFPSQGVGYLFYMHRSSNELAGWFSVVFFTMAIFCSLLSCWFILSYFNILRRRADKKEPLWLVFLQLIKWYVVSFTVSAYDLSFVFNAIKDGYL